MSSILGGWNSTLWISGDPLPATNVGVVTRINPSLDPSLIRVAGSGMRGLQGIILGVRDHRVVIEFIPSSVDSVISFQRGLNISKLHYKAGSSEGLTFINARVNTMDVTCVAGRFLECKMEIWAEEIRELDSGCPWDGTELNDVVSWTEFQLEIARKDDPTTLITNSKWHRWKYKIKNNLRRLANVYLITTRSLDVMRQDVSGTLILDFDDMQEWIDFVGTDASEPFLLNIKSGTSYLIGSAIGVYSQWGKIQAPHGPEDLILKNFEFHPFSLLPQGEVPPVDTEPAPELFGHVISVRYVSDGSTITGLTMGRGNFWYADEWEERIYEIDPSSFALIRSFPMPAGARLPAGMAWDGGFIWVGDRLTQKVYRIDPDTGAVVSSFATPEDPASLAFDGIDLLIGCEPTHDVIYKYTLGGVQLATIQCPFKAYAYAMTYVDPYIYAVLHVWNNISLPIAEFDTQGKLRRMHQIPVSTFLEPHGLTWDGTYLRLGNPDWYSKSSISKVIKDLIPIF